MNGIWCAIRDVIRHVAAAQRSRPYTLYASQPHGIGGS